MVQKPEGRLADNEKKQNHEKQALHWSQKEAKGIVKRGGKF